MLVTIEYCNRWGYRARAVSLAAKIRQAIPAEVRLIESSGGVFEVVVDGVLRYSKKATGQFPADESLVAEIRGR